MKPTNCKNLQRSCSTRHCWPAKLEYILESCVYPTEAAPLKDLRDASGDQSLSVTCPLVGQQIRMLLKLVNAKMIIEIGISNGYSTLLTALTIPEDGQIVAIDPDQKPFDKALPFIEKAGVAHKINFVDSEALPVLDQFVKDKLNRGSFDFAFVNADIVNYINYYERLMKLVKIGGLICFNNMLQEGYVAKSEQDTPEHKRLPRQHCLKFTSAIAQNPNIEICHAPIGNGLLICRRLY